MIVKQKVCAVNVLSTTEKEMNFPHVILQNLQKTYDRSIKHFVELYKKDN